MNVLKNIQKTIKHTNVYMRLSGMPDSFVDSIKERCYYLTRDNKNPDDINYVRNYIKMCWAASVIHYRDFDVDDLRKTKDDQGMSEELIESLTSEILADFESRFSTLDRLVTYLFPDDEDVLFVRNYPITNPDDMT